MLCKTAQISQRAYGLNVTVAMLPGNAGFGAANNIAAQYARSRRLMIVNPDVFRGSRPVSAVSGAFMSIDRPWFEQIGGFATDYIFAYYEDADLCLRSLDRGAVTWVHDLDFWHMEGKGSSTPLAHHQGAALVNRWLFT